MADLAKLVDELSKLTVMEAAELSKLLETTWKVTAVAASAPVASVSVAAATEEKNEFNITLVKVGDNKIAVIKEVRTITGLGLKEAKDLVEGAPKVLKEGIKKEEVAEITKKLEAVGATVEAK